MSVGVLIMPDRDAANVVDDILEKARGAHHAGVRQLWLGEQLDYDAIALASVIGSAVPGVAVGTSVVPINPLDAGATDLALLPIQSELADQRRVWEVAAAFPPHR